MYGRCQASGRMNVLLNAVCNGLLVFRYPSRQYSPAKDDEPCWHNHLADRDQDRAAKTLDKTGEKEACVSRRPRCEAIVLCKQPAVPSGQPSSAMLALRGPIARFTKVSVQGGGLGRRQPPQRLAGPQGTA